MNATTDLDRLLAEWLETEGPGPLPHSVVRSAVLDARTRSRRRPGFAWAIARRLGLERSAPGRRLVAIRPALLLLLAMLLALMVGVMALVGAPTPGPVYDGVFTRTGPMTVARSAHSATLLQDGTVLIAGGTDGLGGVTAELYDPTTGTFRPTGRMAAGRSGHVAVLLEDGRVLVVGGFADGSLASRTAELYDPVSRTFAPTGSPGAPGWVGRAVRLADGRVLVFREGRAGAEVFDPGSESFETVEVPTIGSGATVVVLADGSSTLLIAGDIDGATTSEAWIVDPDSVAPVAAGTLRGATIDPLEPDAEGPWPRRDVSAALLADGRVLVVGGGRGPGPSSCMSSRQRPGTRPDDKGPSRRMPCRRWRWQPYARSARR